MTKRFCIFSLEALRHWQKAMDLGSASPAIKEKIQKYKDIVALPNPPKCECKLEPEGVSGNMKLDVKASYSPYRYSCFPNLRTFLYSRGPVYLAHVVKEPNVTEVDKHGTIIRKIS